MQGSKDRHMISIFLQPFSSNLAPPSQSLSCYRQSLSDVKRGEIIGWFEWKYVVGEVCLVSGYLATLDPISYAMVSPVFATLDSIICYAMFSPVLASGLSVSCLVCWSQDILCQGII